MAALMLLPMLIPAACTVETDVPPDALLTCFEDSHCPDAWSCDLSAGLCLSPGQDSPIDPELAEARETFCEALWYAAQRCQPELEEAMGETALLFTLPRPTFLFVCSTRLLEDTTEEDTSELMGGAVVVPLLSCDDLVELLCEEMGGEEDPVCG